MAAFAKITFLMEVLVTERTREPLMPVKIESFEPLSEEEFPALQQQKARKTDPAMAALLAEIATGQPVRVPLVEGQSARGLRTAISRAATSRGMTWRPLKETASWRYGRSMRRERGSRRSKQPSQGSGGGGHRSGRTTRWTRSWRQRTTSGSSRNR